MSFNMIFLICLAMMTIRLLLDVAMLNTMFLCAIIICLFISTFIRFVIMFLTFEALMNTIHRFVIFHHVGRIFVYYVMIYQFIRYVDIYQIQYHKRKVLFMIFFWNSSYFVYLQIRVKCDVHFLQRFDCLFVSFLVLSEYAFDSFIMYYNDIDLTLQIHLFANFFCLFFVTF